MIVIDCLRSRTFLSQQSAGNVPQLDSLTKRGALFPSTVATATTTSPSVASLLTGTLPFSHGIRSLRGFKLNPNVATLAEILKDAGYETRAEVTGPLSQEQGLDRGFDHYHHRLDRVYGPAWQEIWKRLRTLPERRPWFQLLHLFELHQKPSVPTAFNSRTFGRTRYERALAALDQVRLGEVLRLVTEQDIAVVTSDHGEVVPPLLPILKRSARLARFLRSERIMHFLRRRFGHGFHVYEDLILVPTILAGRGIPQGIQVDSAVRHIDLFNTVLDLVGVHDPRRRQSPGESLVPFFTETQRPDRPGYSEAVGVTLPGPKAWLVCVRAEGFKYVKRADGSRSWLWRLPDEKRDVSGQRPEMVQRMEALLTEFQAGETLTATGQEMTAAEEQEVEAHLRELGYLE